MKTDELAKTDETGKDWWTDDWVIVWWLQMTTRATTRWLKKRSMFPESFVSKPSRKGSLPSLSFGRHDRRASTRNLGRERTAIWSWIKFGEAIHVNRQSTIENGDTWEKTNSQQRGREGMFSVLDGWEQGKLFVLITLSSFMFYILRQLIRFPD